ncbi:hypothetical protein A2U01_0086957, partial [Trifolium medium]|nr:hypothetical protein [Trifolium medium]
MNPPTVGDLSHLPMLAFVMQPDNDLSSQNRALRRPPLRVAPRPEQAETTHTQAAPCAIHSCATRHEQSNN